MPARKYLHDYEQKLGQKITGLDRAKFNSASANDYINCTCSCGNEFKSKKADLANRFNRGGNIRCRTCVCTENGNVEKGKRG